MSIPSVRLHRRTPDSLKSIRIVLVSPSHPGNVGAAARAMRTMGLEDLALVAPRDAAIVRDPQAVALASGATAILDRATVYPTLEAAIAQIGLAVAVLTGLWNVMAIPMDELLLQLCQRRAVLSPKQRIPRQPFLQCIPRHPQRRLSLNAPLTLRPNAQQRPFDNQGTRPAKLIRQRSV